MTGAGLPGPAQQRGTAVGASARRAPRLLCRLRAMQHAAALRPPTAHPSHLSCPPGQAGISDTLRNLLATSSLLAAGTVSPGNVLRSAEQVRACACSSWLGRM